MACFRLILTTLLFIIAGMGTLPARQSSPTKKTSSKEQWIVQFKNRSFDLAPFKAAVLQGDQDELNKLIQDMEKRCLLDRQNFIRQLEALGGKVLQHWWIINACAIHLPQPLLSRLQSREDVLSISPDLLHVPCILTSTNGKNHNADALQAKGIRGIGTSIAVLDTGQDAQMGRSGRPHRTYYINGNLNNKSGKGIGGTRLLTNKKMGLQAPEDAVGHGTSVSGIAAGAKWGPTGSDYGHAFGARIAGYSIADTALGSAQSSTIIRAWQEVAKDRLRLGITVANNSYSGSPNPLDPVQKALDSVALNADILICVPAGNTGTTTVRSQSAANGLAVGAVDSVAHKLANFSSRGPLSGDSARTYPDLVACGVKIVTPLLDGESTTAIVSGTSMSAPQVAGAAALLRGAFPKLRADETKALLLATSQSLSWENKGLGPNGLGQGFLRDDLAYDAASKPLQHLRNRLTSTTPTLNIQLPIQKGRVYSIALAWFRNNLSSKLWSNLDLEVLDGTKNLASSRSLRNLYERVLFLAPKTGTLLLRITGKTLAGGKQEFALAWSDRVPLHFPGTFSSFGKGCPGTGTSMGKVTCISRNGKGGTLNRTPILSPNQIFALQITSTNTLSISGFDLYSQYLAKISIPTYLFLDNNGKPAKYPIRTSTMSISTQGSFASTSFSPPLQIKKGTRFYLGFKTPAISFGFSVLLTSGLSTPYYWNSSNWSGPWKGAPFSWRIQCAILQKGAIPRLQNLGVPEVGKVYTLLLDQARPLSPCVLFTGLSNTSYANIPLPLDFGLFGAKGCSLFVSGEFLFPFLCSAQGKAKLPTPIPSMKALIGTRFYQQILVLDPQANTLGMVFSNAGNGSMGGER
jgi:hypothetical protein